MAEAHDMRANDISDSFCYAVAVEGSCEESGDGGAREEISPIGHPLHHAAYLCIDHVARDFQRRKKRKQDDQYWSDVHRTMLPYLCTSYDAYLTQEPCVFCAMALLHSRIHRVFFHRPNEKYGGLGSAYGLHEVKSLNHRFRVYQVE